jgi:hypothetical protein
VISIVAADAVLCCKDFQPWNSPIISWKTLPWSSISTPDKQHACRVVSSRAYVDVHATATWQTQTLGMSLTVTACCIYCWSVTSVYFKIEDSSCQHHAVAAVVCCDAQPVGCCTALQSRTCGQFRSAGAEVSEGLLLTPLTGTKKDSST